MSEQMNIEKSFTMYRNGIKPRDIIKLWDNRITLNHLRVMLFRYKKIKEKTP